MVKGTLLFIVALALSGYINLSKSYSQRYSVKKLEGHLLLYRLLYRGFLFFVIALSIFLSFEPTSFVLYKNAEAKIITEFPNVSSYDIKVITLMLLTILLSYVISVLNNFLRISINYAFWNSYNFFNRLQHRLLKGEHVQNSAESDLNPDNYKPISFKVTKEQIKWTYFLRSEKNEMKKHLMRSLEDLILVTLSTDKCYVGYPIEDKLTSEEFQNDAFSMIPYASGFRDSDKKLVLNHFYEEVIAAIAAHKKPGPKDDKNSRHDFKNRKSLIKKHLVSIPFREVIVISNFSKENIESQKKTR